MFPDLNALLTEELQYQDGETKETPDFRNRVKHEGELINDTEEALNSAEYLSQWEMPDLQTRTEHEETRDTLAKTETTTDFPEQTLLMYWSLSQNVPTPIKAEKDERCDMSRGVNDDSGNTSLSQQSHALQNNETSIGDPFMCKVCDRRFVRRAGLTRHLKKHSTQKQEQRVTYDIKSESGDQKPYKCPCGKMFRRLSSLRGHMKVIHPNNQHMIALDLKTL